MKKLPADISGADYKEEVITAMLARIDELWSAVEAVPARPEKWEEFQVAKARLNEAKYIIATCLPQIKRLVEVEE
jgi:hypothetical protein